jgi:acetolactate synthase small subunit
MPSAAARSLRPDYSRDSSDRETRPAACFSVHARAEPGIMPRVMELFAKRGLVPSSWHSATSESTGGGAGELTIDIQMRDMPVELAEFIAAKLRQIADVEIVLTSQKR